MTNAEQTKTMRAHAKINLCLYVLNKRDDGYHNIKSLMQMVDFGDEVTVTHTDETGIVLKTNDMSLPVDEKNIAHRAAALMMETFHLHGGFLIEIEKKIPVAGGLAGGSTNAAAVMHLINDICDLSLPFEKLAELGALLGADVPFCLFDKPAKAEGIGEILTPVCGLKDCYIVLVNPGVGVSTAEIYHALDSEERPMDADMDSLIDALSEGDLKRAFLHMENHMQKAAEERCPQIGMLIDKLYEAGADYAMMSGSGASCFGVFVKEPNSAKLQNSFGKNLVAITKPVI